MVNNQRAAIVSAADAGFFPMLRGLVQSLHDRGWQTRADLFVIDLGLTGEQRAELSPLVTGIAEGRWEMQFPKVEAVPRWFQAMVSRPLLPELFPGYPLYAWLDADLWLADNRALALLLNTAHERGMCIVPEIHAAYEWFRNVDWVPRKNTQKCYAAGWGEEMAARLIQLPVLNSGFFAATPGHPVWGKWAEELRGALQKTNHMLVEQCALNVVLYQGGVEYGVLPAWCNWVCHQAMPRYNDVKRRFEEPIPPFAPISVVHAAGNKHVMVRFMVEGKEVKVAFNYLALREGNLLCPPNSIAASSIANTTNATQRGEG